MTPEIIKVGSKTLSASNTEQFDLLVKGGGTYKRLFLRFFNGASAATVAAAKTAVASISMTASDNTGSIPLIDKATVEVLLMLEPYFNSYKGLTANVAGELTIDPSSVLGLNAFDRRIYSLGTLGLTGLTVDVAASASITGVTRVELWAEYDRYDIQPLGAYVTIRKIAPAIAADANSLEITDIPKFDRTFGIAALHIGQLNSSVISSVEVKLDGKNRILPDVPKAILDRRLILNRRTPQSPFTHIDFSAEDFAGAFLDGGMEELLVTPTFSTAPTAGGNLPIWVVAMKLPANMVR